MSEGKVYFIEGTIQPHGKGYVHIYVKGKTSKKLLKYLGKKVKGFIMVIENEDKEE